MAASSDDLLTLYHQMTATARKEFQQKLEEHWQERATEDKARSSAEGRTHRAIGRVIFANPVEGGERQPLHSMRVELWDRDFGPDDFLGDGMTDRDGRFEIWYNPKDAGWKDLPDLELRICDWEYTYDRKQQLVIHYNHVATFPGANDVEVELYDFGELEVAYWQYDPEAATPRVHVPERGNPPQAYPPGRAIRMVHALGSLQIKKKLHQMMNKIDPDSPSLETIQDAYPPSLSMQVDQKRPGHSRSDEYFAERILNGMSASILDRDPKDPNRLWLHHHWNSYAQDDEHAMPSVDVWFELRDGLPWPVEIALQFRKRGHKEKNAPQEEPQHFTPADGAKWEQAKRVARVSAALYAELDIHLGQTHLNTEQYAMATYRNLRCNPLRRLLHPHVREVILINHEANEWLLGETGYITRSTAFTADSLNERIRQSLGTLDWKNWQPRKQLSDRHQFAQAAHLFWEVVTEYVDWFFEQNRQEIVDHWYEVHRFSQDLVKHSVPAFLCGFLSGCRKEQPSDGGSLLGDWFEPNERMDLSVPRAVVDGQERAIQPVTNSDTCDDAGWDNMKQVCRYVIHHATFMHTWSNSRQYDDGGELTYNGLGLRYGKNGVLSPESDHSICPPPGQATEQLWFSWLLSNAGYGFIMQNEDRDIHPKLVEFLRQRKQDFAAIGVDINSIQSRTNI